ncbi:YbhB/YbcL family Raf kinase inhibitor-like protein, partial [Candidatus Heimdallarchaeota archaeon]
MMADFKLSSPVFKHNGSIPKKYTCQGEDISPPLKIANIPDKTKSLVLIVDDPDAPVGTWIHWLAWDIDPKITNIEEASTPKGATIGKNSWGKNEYGGPCPPKGEHRYFFKLYALDKTLNINSRKKKSYL